MRVHGRTATEGDEEQTDIPNSLSSLPLDAGVFARCVRNQWGDREQLPPKPRDETQILWMELEVPAASLRCPKDCFGSPDT